MSLVRRIARPMLASVFVIGGFDQLRKPGGRPQAAVPLARRISAMTGLPDDPTLLVRVNGAVMMTAGALLASSRMPRTSAAVLAATLVPTTVVGHPFWKKSDAGKRSMDRTQFLKNAGLVGGLLLAVVDTDGKPGLAYRARLARQQAEQSVRRGRRTVRWLARSAKQDAKITALQAQHALS